MRKFLKYILGVKLMIVMVAIVLDISYTEIYKQGVARNKITQSIKLKAHHFDAIFLGSSRVENHIKTELFTPYNFKVLNLGIQGGTLLDNLLSLDLLLQNGNTIDVMFIQIDNVFNAENNNEITRSVYMPYIREDYFFNKLKTNNETSLLLEYYLPFYRYAVNDFKIGFREVFATFIDKQNPYLIDGFKPLHGTSKLQSYMLPKNVKTENLALKQIEILAKKNNIKLIKFCAPFCSQLENKNYLRDLKTKVAPLYDYSNIISDEFFMDCGHLNEKGATIFTKFIIQKHFINSIN